jgi:dipeptidyl aminopeptidase/acylaminoacyl peptidase
MQNLRTLKYLAVIAMLVLAAQSAVAKPTMPDILRATYGVHDISAVQLSPDGTMVLWTETFRNAQKLSDPIPKTAIYLSATRPGSRKTRLTAGNGRAFANEFNPVWAPDGKKIAFLSDARTPSQPQLFVAKSDGSNIRQLSHFKGNVSDARWSPKGDRIAFLYIQDATRPAGATQVGDRRTGVIEETAQEQRLTLIDMNTQAIHVLSPADQYVYEYDWSPDGRAFALSLAPGNGDNNWWIARLATMNASTGALHEVLKPELQFAQPRWSPDGKSIAFIGGIMSDEGSTGGDVYLVDAQTGNQKDLTPNFDASAAELTWVDGTHVAMIAHTPGGEKIDLLSVGDGALEAFGSGEESINSLSVGGHGNTYAAVRSSFEQPPELFIGWPKNLRQFTHSNAGNPRLWGKAVSLRWKSDEFEPQGWLVYPQDFNSARTYPMIVLPHGGPAAQNLPSWGSRNTSALSSQGYFVFLPNPRGSYGQGERFTEANIKDFGYGDFRDIMTGVDKAIASAPIDPHRIGLMGWSYGGYVAMWAETQTDRFKAIVAGAGLSNWQSYYGENQIDQWMIPYFGKSVYDDPAVYARSSPMTFIKNAKSPVLMLQGERDEEVPATQSFEFWHALKTLGVPTQLVVYKDEGHGIRKPADQIDMLNRILKWFNHYV